MNNLIYTYGVCKLKIYKIGPTTKKGNKLIEKYDINLKLKKRYKKEKYKRFYYLYYFNSLEAAASFVINIFIKMNDITKIKTSLFIDTFQNKLMQEHVKYYQNCGKIEGKYERYVKSVKIDEMDYINGVLMKFIEYYENGNIKRIFIPSESELLYDNSNKFIIFENQRSNKVYDFIIHLDTLCIYSNGKNDFIDNFKKIYKYHSVFGDWFEQYIEYRPGKIVKLDEYFRFFVD